MSNDTNDKHEDWTKNGPHENTMAGAPTGRDRDNDADEALVKKIREKAMAGSISREEVQTLKKETGAAFAAQGAVQSKWAEPQPTDEAHFKSMRTEKREPDFFEAFGIEAMQDVPEAVTEDYAAGQLSECHDFYKSLRGLDFEIRTTVSNGLDTMSPESLFKHQGMAQIVKTIMDGVKGRIEELEE